VLKNIESEPTTDLTAYDYYLQGKEYFNIYVLSGHEEDLNNADRLFQIAIDRDSTFALAYVGQARILRMQYQFDFYKNENLVDSVLYLCNKAISLDPYSADAYWIRGSFYDDFLFDIPQAETDLNKALEINPNHVGAIRQMAWLSRLHHKDVITSIKLLKTLEKLDRSAKELRITYGAWLNLYMDIGEWKKGMYYLNKVIELEPEWIFVKGEFYVLQGKIKEAIELIMKVEDDSQYKLALLGLYHLLIKENEKSLEYFEEWAVKVKNEGAENASGVKDWHRYGQALVAMGKKEEGIQLMNDQLELNENLLVNFQSGYTIFYDNAGIYSFLGKKKLAYKYLRKFDKSGRWQYRVYFIQLDPLFDNIRDDEEFKTIINKELEENRKIREEISRLETAGEL